MDNQKQEKRDSSQQSLSTPQEDNLLVYVVNLRQLFKKIILKICETWANVYITLPEDSKIENDSSDAAMEKPLIVNRNVRGEAKVIVVSTFRDCN